MGETAHEGYVGQGHLAGPIGGEGDAGVGAAEFDVGVGVRGHLQLVVAADQELGKAGDEGDLATGGQARGGGNNVLLGDAPFKILVGTGLSEQIGKGGVFDVAIQGYNPFVGFTECRQGGAVGPTGG